MNFIYNLIIKDTHPIHWCPCHLHFSEEDFYEVIDDGTPYGCNCGAEKAYKKWYTYILHLFYIRYNGLRNRFLTIKRYLLKQKGYKEYYKNKELNRIYII